MFCSWRGKIEWDHEICTRFSSTPTLTAGSGSKGYVQALWKSFLLKNCNVFQIQPKSLKQPETGSELFRQWSFWEQYNLPFPMCPCCILPHLPEKLPCCSSGCSSLSVLFCSHPLLIGSSFPLDVRVLIKENAWAVFPVSSIFCLADAWIWMSDWNWSVCCLCSLTPLSQDVLDRHSVIFFFWGYAKKMFRLTMYRWGK